MLPLKYFRSTRSQIMQNSLFNQKHMYLGEGKKKIMYLVQWIVQTTVHILIVAT